MAASKWYSTPPRNLPGASLLDVSRWSLPGRRQEQQRQQAVQGARMLGWASIGLGLLEVLAPKAAQQTLGLPRQPQQDGVMRVLGMREVMHGLSILAEGRANRKLASAVEGRVLGDVLDVALLGVAATRTRQPARWLAVAAMVSAIGLLDIRYARKLRKICPRGEANGNLSTAPAKLAEAIGWARR